MTKIEEVARAIAASCEGDGSKWGAWTHEARAAIAAMRGPTKEMALAWMGTTDYGDDKTLFAAKFNAMLDAVLAEDR